VLLGWLAAAVVAGGAGVATRVPPPALGIAITIVALALVWRVASLRDWSAAVGLRALVLLHVSRALAGWYFLVTSSRGELPRVFAVPAGVGDIAVGLAALGVARWALPPISVSRVRAVLAWNAIGLIDIAFVLFNAVRLFLAAPQEMQALTRLPLVLLPLYLVPLVIVSHALIFVRFHEADSKLAKA